MAKHALKNVITLILTTHPFASHKFRMGKQAKGLPTKAWYFSACCAVKVTASFPYIFFLIACLLFGGPVVSDALYPLIQMCYLCFQAVPRPNVYIFRLVLVGHTDYATFTPGPLRK